MRSTVLGRHSRLLLAALGPLLVAASASAGDAPGFQFSFGGAGSGDGQLDFPCGIRIDGDDVYIVENSNRRISVFDLDGNFQRSFGSAGSGEGQLFTPRHLAVDALGNVYVTDDQLDKVVKFDSQGNFLLEWGGEGSADGQLNLPAGIEIDGDGDVWVADRINRSLKEFDSDGNFKSKFSDTSITGLTDVVITPTAVYLGIWNTIFEGVMKFDHSWNLLAQSSHIEAPQGIGMAPGGNLYVAAGAISHAVGILDPETLAHVTSWGGYGDEPEQFHNPYDVAVTADGEVFVSDGFHDLVKVFGVTTALEPMSWARIKAKFR